MPDPGRLSDQEAARRRRAWLDGRRRWNRDLVVVLLRYAPEADVAHVLDRLSAGELQRLARLLTDATDLHQVARRIVADLRQHRDRRPGWAATRPAGPDHGGADAAVTTGDL
jgi:hypothetical protein